MRFADRRDAAVRLAEQLAVYRGQAPVVMGLPRGGVPMAWVIADALAGVVDVMLVRKLRAQDQPEFAIGAVDETGTVVRGPYFDAFPAAYVQQEIAQQLALLAERRETYAALATPADVVGRVVILVDDGIGTGATMLAAVRAVKARHAHRVVVAVGVAPPESVTVLGAEADEVVCLHAPTAFDAVGRFFADFSEVSDQDVATALRGPAVS
jgi:predicted phosphoribosyltransferase